MTLTRRFSTLFLGSLALVLVAFSACLYVSARVYLERRVVDRLAAALAVLSAAAEVHPGGVEWEPRGRDLPTGLGTGEDRLRWFVLDGEGAVVDGSAAFGDAERALGWLPRPGIAALPARLVDGRGHAWRVAQRRIGSGRDLAETTTGETSLHPSLTLTACAPLEPMGATLGALAWSLAGTGGATWLLAALLCRRVSRRALAPLTRMVESAQGLDAADPGWSLAVAGTGDELDDLGHAFNDLLARLHAASERHRRFAGDASHQLRTPLTVLIGQIEVALRRERSGEEYRRALRSALGGAAQLGQVVEALLFLGRAEGDAAPPEGAPLDLGAWAAGHVAARPGPPRVRHVGCGPPPWVVGHPPLLGQLLDNLLDNAAKHGRPGGEVLVETAEDGPSALLAVQDEGPGVAPEDLDRVFEPFYRSAAARRGGTPGVGLGLAIVRRIAVASGGSVAVRSRPGLGCRVEVRLPATQGTRHQPIALWLPTLRDGQSGTARIPGSGLISPLRGASHPCRTAAWPTCRRPS